MQPIYFEWFIDDQKQSSMNINSSIQIESKPNFSLLTIRNLTLASAGIYQCNARNVYGIDSTRIQLRVKGLIDSFLLTVRFKNVPNLDFIIRKYGKMWRYRSHKFFFEIRCPKVGN